MNQTVDQVSEKTHEAVDVAARLAKEAEERLRDISGKAGDRSHDLLESVTVYVKENPLTALGLAFIAGSLLSGISRR